MFYIQVFQKPESTCNSLIVSLYAQLLVIQSRILEETEVLTHSFIFNTDFALQWLYCH